MSDSIDRQFAELMARVELTSDRMDRESADGWVVVCLDLEPPVSVVYVSGVFDEPEQALAHAGVEDERAKEAHGEQEHGWSHVVVPIYFEGQS